MSQTTLKIEDFTERPSRRDKALPLIETLKAVAEKHDVIELDFCRVHDIHTGYMDQIATSTANSGFLDRIVYVIRPENLKNLKLISGARQLKLRYRFPQDTDPTELKEPPLEPPAETTKADITELPPSPYDPNPKEPL